MSSQDQLSGDERPLVHHFSHPPERVVSLVPSMTESLFDLGFGASVVGVTDYCVHPAAGVSGLPRLGGPKNPRVVEIIDLQPDLVIANFEENTRQSVEALEAAGVRVWVTFPKTVRQALDILWTLAMLYQSPTAAARVESLEIGLDWVERAAQNREPIRYFCPIWYDETQERQAWWMTFNQHTYPHDVLDALGAVNVFAGRERRYPLDADLGWIEPVDPARRDTRYPRVSADEILAADPDAILLPDEPYNFTETHQEQLKEQLGKLRAVRDGSILRFDGSLITWHGTRLGKALQILPALLDKSLLRSL